MSSNNASQTKVDLLPGNGRRTQNSSLGTVDSSDGKADFMFDGKKYSHNIAPVRHEADKPRLMLPAALDDNYKNFGDEYDAATGRMYESSKAITNNLGKNLAVETLSYHEHTT